MCEQLLVSRLKVAWDYISGLQARDSHLRQKSLQINIELCTKFFVEEVVYLSTWQSGVSKIKEKAYKL